MHSIDRTKPYNDLSLLPPKQEVQTRKVLIKTISASRALGKLNGALSNLPNPNLFLDTIHLKEAKASSEIENIITTNDEIYKSLIADKSHSNLAAKEIISYKSALWQGLRELEKRPLITTNLFVKIVQIIKQNTAGIRVTPGTALLNCKGEKVYTPPTGVDVIRDKLENLERFINTDDSIDPLIKMAIIHYQFEAIHPFSDGNGRAGRILIILYLKMTNLLEVPGIYLSEYIIKNKVNYYKALRGVTEHSDWETFILYMLDMVEETSVNVIHKLEEIIKLKDEVEEYVKKSIPKIYSRELLDIIFKLPYTKRKNLIDQKMGTPKTVGKYLSELEAIRVLASVKVGKEKLYINKDLLKILE